MNAAPPILGVALNIIAHACVLPPGTISRPDVLRTEMNDEPATAVAQPAPATTNTSESGRENGRGRGGIIARGEEQAAKAISGALTALGFSPRAIEFRPLPFAGTWGLATSVAFALATEAAARELEADGALDGLTKKEARALT